MEGGGQRGRGFQFHAREGSTRPRKRPLCARRARAQRPEHPLAAPDEARELRAHAARELLHGAAVGARDVQLLLDDGAQLGVQHGERLADRVLLQELFQAWWFDRGGGGVWGGEGAALSALATAASWWRRVVPPFARRRWQ